MNFRKKAKVRVRDRWPRYRTHTGRHILALRDRVSTQHKPKAYIVGLADGYDVADESWEFAHGYTGRTKAVYLRGVREGLDTRHAAEIDEVYPYEELEGK